MIYFTVAVSIAIPVLVAVPILVPVTTALAATTTANTQAANQSPSLEQLQSAALFGRYQAKQEVAVTQPVLADAPQTSLNLKLTGVVATRLKPEQGTAIIENNGVEQVYAVDEQIEGTAAVLKQVLEDRVLLQVSGMGEKSSAKFSTQGLTVNGSAYQGGSTTEPAKAAQPEKPKSGKS